MVGPASVGTKRPVLCFDFGVIARLVDRRQADGFAPGADAPGRCRKADLVMGMAAGMAADWALVEIRLALVEADQAQFAVDRLAEIAHKDFVEIDPSLLVVPFPVHLAVV